MQWSKLKPWLLLLFTLIVLGVAAWYVATHREELSVIWRLSPTALVAIAAAVAVTLALGGFQLRIFLRRYGVLLRWYRWFGLYMVMSVANIVTPARGGTGLCAVYLKSAHGLPLSRFAIVLVGTYVLTATINSAAALVGMGLSWWLEGVFSLPLTIGAAAILAACTVTYFVPNLRESQRWGWRYAVQAINGWHALVRDRSLLWKVAAVNLGQCLSQVVCYLLVLHGLGLSVPPTAALTIVSMSLVAALISATPAAPGPYDAAVVALPTLFGLTVAQAVAALLVLRAVSLVTSFALAAVFGLAARPAAGWSGTPAAKATDADGDEADADADATDDDAE
jgi:uncharacterized membrane protein YbhN (UPF0104 family)